MNSGLLPGACLGTQESGLECQVQGSVFHATRRCHCQAQNGLRDPASNFPVLFYVSPHLAKSSLEFSERKHRGEAFSPSRQALKNYYIQRMDMPDTHRQFYIQIIKKIPHQ